MRHVLSEPIVHFLLLGLVIVAAGTLWRNQEPDRYRIVMSASKVQDIASKYAAQYGAVPTSEQLKALSGAALRAEVLYREGVALGLDKGDEIVRRRIIQKAEFLLQDLTVDPEPTEAQLVAWYRAHSLDYAIAERESFTHIYFSADQGGDAAAVSRARKLLAELQKHPTARAPELGDRFPELYDYASLSEAEVVRVFGQNDFSSNIFDAPVGQWSGPFKSGFGWHLVRVSAREPARIAPLAEVMGTVRTDWQEAMRAKANDEAFARLRAKYQIERDEQS